MSISDLSRVLFFLSSYRLEELPGFTLQWTVGPVRGTVDKRMSQAAEDMKIFMQDLIRKLCK
jgi:hypothetical protein